MAVRQGARFLWGSESLAGKTIAVQGLGAVGFPLASAYLADGAQLIVCDRDAASIERFVTAHQGAVVRVVSPDEILRVEAEIFSPAAGGGILTEENIATLRFKLIMGGANNVLTASSQEEEIELAEQLAGRGILYQIDWWHNIAGVMAGYEEYVLQREADLRRLLEKVGRRCADSTWENLNEARREQITPTERAYRVAEREVYGEQEPAR
jgi:leucine dehydrogenase